MASATRWISTCVLISFREWLHSYEYVPVVRAILQRYCSHLFQRVASFLRAKDLLWLLLILNRFSSLSESGFIPTTCRRGSGTPRHQSSSHLFQRVASFLPPPPRGACLFILLFSSHLFQRVASFLLEVRSRHFYGFRIRRSHLFQRVASFLLSAVKENVKEKKPQFSSLSESGFIPTA